MQVVAVPVKSPELSKSRLAPLLSPAERAALTLAMLADVLEVALAVPGWQTWVVSSGPALRLAAGRGARPIPERGRSLIEAVRQAESLLGGEDELAILLGDLPLITAAALGAALRAPGAVVAAPAASDGGTNLLLRRPPAVIPARFGVASFARHRWEAVRIGEAVQVVPGAALGFDLDRPEDLARFLDAPRPGRTLSACLEMGLPARLRVGTPG